jgi:hypothetical protein
MRRSFILQFALYSLIIGTVGTFVGLILGAALGYQSIPGLFMWGFLGAVLGIGTGGSLGAYLASRKREAQEMPSNTRAGQEAAEAEGRWLPRWVELAAALISILICIGLMFIFIQAAQL